MPHPIVVTDDTFAQAVEQRPGLAVVDLWAEWCGPCHILAPLVERLANDYAGRLTVAKLNVDENAATMARFGVRSIPTLLFFRDGALVDRTIGVMPYATLSMKVSEMLARATPVNLSRTPGLVHVAG